MYWLPGAIQEDASAELLNNKMVPGRRPLRKIVSVVIFLGYGNVIGLLNYNTSITNANKFKFIKKKFEFFSSQFLVRSFEPFDFG